MEHRNKQVGVHRLYQVHTCVAAGATRNLGVGDGHVGRRGEPPLNQSKDLIIPGGRVVNFNSGLQALTVVYPAPYHAKIGKTTIFFRIPRTCLAVS